jgi:hypothetical protein
MSRLKFFNLGLLNSVSKMAVWNLCDPPSYAVIADNTAFRKKRKKKEKEKSIYA